MGIDTRRSDGMNTWDYAAITQAAEERITGLMDRARQTQANDKQLETRLLRQWAYGVYLLWDDLTIGWQNDGDDARMEALTDMDATA